jgi:peptidoglycan/LPS O-acetylase OafA/YrhL
MSIDSKSKNPWIQILRAISVLVVIAYHFELPISNGFIGVDIFFVISGYVITQSLMRSSEASRLSRLKVFYIKRIARLFPAFLVVFIFTIISSILFLSPNVGIQQNAIKSSLGATLGISNFVIPRVTGDYFGATGTTNPFQHTWSLSVEEQFYFIFPLIFLLFISKKIRNGYFFSPIIILAVLTAMSFSILLPLDVANRFSNLGTTEYFAPQNRAWEFLAGAIVALISASKPNLHVMHKALILTGLCGALVFISVSNFFAFQENLYLLIIPVVLSSIFLLVSDMKSSESQQIEIFSRFRNLMEILGDWSYSLYLWHWPIWIFTKLFLPESTVISIFSASILTLSFSALTYKLIEKRFNFANISRVSYWVKFFLIGQVLAISLFFIGYLGGSHGWGKDWALNSHAIVQKGCDSGLIDLKKCSWGSSKAKESMFIVGDSMSWAIGDAFISSALGRDMKAFSLTRNGCSITRSSFDATSECGVWRNKVITLLIQEKPELVVIANAIGYPEEDIQGMGKLVSALRDSSIKVIFVTPPPGGDNYSELRALAFRPGAPSREKEPPARPDLSLYDLYKLSNDPGLLVYDPADDLCSSTCAIAKDGKDYYNYGAHLSLHGNNFLQDSVNEKVERMLGKSSL